MSSLKGVLKMSSIVSRSHKISRALFHVGIMLMDWLEVTKGKGKLGLCGRGIEFNVNSVLDL